MYEPVRENPANIGRQINVYELGTKEVDARWEIFLKSNNKWESDRYSLPIITK